MQRFRSVAVVLLFLAAVGASLIAIRAQKKTSPPASDAAGNAGQEQALTPRDPIAANLSIASLRSGIYPGSDIAIIRELEPGSNYRRYLTTYQSEGNTIYALLTVPTGQKPPTGWPVVVFNHGYIPPKEYRTTERYIAYTDAFSRSGYILFRPDYRGHGDSGGQAVGAYGSNAYSIDVLNAVASVKRYADADPGRIGMWGHSMGGFITLRVMVSSRDVKAGVIWGGVVGSFADMFANWRRSPTTPPPAPSGMRGWRQSLVEKYGEPEKNPTFWDSISANAFLADISGPLQLHHGTADESVPVSFSETLKRQMESAGKQVELFIYDGDDHNLTANLYTALARSVAFFDRYLKPSPTPSQGTQAPIR